MTVRSFLRNAVEENAEVKRALAHIIYGRETFARFFGSGKGAGDGALVFTTQKGGSVFLKVALRLMCHAYQKKNYDYEGLYWHTQDEDVSTAIERDAERLFNHSNAIYGPLREFIPIPHLSFRPIVLILRDPRDVLVSAYYSRAHSHSLPGGSAVRREFLKKREFALSVTLDQHVIFGIEEYLPKYQGYSDSLLRRPNVACLTYENMVTNFREWATSLIRGLGLEPRGEVLDLLQAAYETDEVLPTSTDKALRHRRQGTPREFERVLAPETISRLNDAFGPVLNKFGLWAM